VYVVGDTPHDIACGAAIGARTIAVATGRHSAEDLAALHPWRALSQLPSAGEFLALLRDSEVPTDV
jgi:phosphoglycolate phosphatase-like HAD superfamily hydrolase